MKKGMKIETCWNVISSSFLSFHIRTSITFVRENEYENRITNIREKRKKRKKNIFKNII